MRKLATIRKIDEVRPIPDADAIEACRVGGWWVVAKKGEFMKGDLAVYAEVDSWIPHELAPFLSKGKEPREFEGIKGERLRTIRLKGQISQGLLLPMRVLGEEIDKKVSSPKMLKENLTIAIGNDDEPDVSQLLGIVKWEAPIPTEIAGEVNGPFPSHIPKTDQERIQNLSDSLDHLKTQTFEITEKLDGTSMTVFLNEGIFGVCSRNYELKRSEKNTLWSVAIREGLEEKMREVGGNFAIQGELVGPGIQGNKYKLDKNMFFVFDVFRIDTQTYEHPLSRRRFCEEFDITHVPVVQKAAILSSDATIEDILKDAEIQSVLNPDVLGEGIVYKSHESEVSFKAISNKWLIKNG